MRGANTPGVSTSRICVSPDHGDAENAGAGGLHLRRDDADLAADQAVDQGGLADVGRADDSDEAAAPLTAGRVIATVCTAGPLTPAGLPSCRAPTPQEASAERTLVSSDGGSGALGGAFRRARRLDRIESLDGDLDTKHRRVRRPAPLDLTVGRQRHAASLRPFLQYRLGILRRRYVPLDQLAPQAFDDLCRHREAAVQVDRGDQRLAGIGQQAGVAAAAGILLAPRKPQAVRQVELLGDLHQRFAADQGGVPAGERADFLAGKAVEQQVGDDEAEHAVADEFQALVAVARALALEAGVGERLREQPLRGEACGRGDPAAPDATLRPAAPLVIGCPGTTG